jgi:hypothetical protein
MVSYASPCEPDASVTVGYCLHRWRDSVSGYSAATSQKEHSGVVDLGKSRSETGRDLQSSLMNTLAARQRSWPLAAVLVHHHAGHDLIAAAHCLLPFPSLPPNSIQSQPPWT